MSDEPITLDFSNLPPDSGGFTPVPPGKYYVRVTDVIADRTTRSGDPMWSLKLMIVHGPHRTRYAFDNLVFNPRSAAYNRVLLVCSRLKLPVSRETTDFKLRPSDLIGRFAAVQLEIEQYTDSLGNQKKRNSVPFAGWESVTEEQVATLKKEWAELEATGVVEMPETADPGGPSEDGLPF